MEKCLEIAQGKEKVVHSKVKNSCLSAVRCSINILSLQCCITNIDIQPPHYSHNWNFTLRKLWKIILWTEPKLNYIRFPRVSTCFLMSLWPTNNWEQPPHTLLFTPKVNWASAASCLNFFSSSTPTHTLVENEDSINSQTWLVRAIACLNFSQRLGGKNY